MIVEKYWTSVARMLQIEASGMNGLVPHQGERGRANELTLARLLENLLPPSIGVGSGIVIDSTGSSSKQADIVLFNRNSQPQVIAQSLQLTFPVEVVYGALEVKSRLTSADITDVGRKVASHRALRPDGATAPFYGLFAYEFGDSDIGRAQELVAMDAGTKPDIACVINPGFFLQGDSSYGFVPLHRRDKEGHPIAGAWAEPDGQQSLVVDGIEHPAFSIRKYRRNTHVGDPGRTMLLFASALLSRLGPPFEGTNWLKNYLHSTAEELYWPQGG